MEGCNRQPECPWITFHFCIKMWLRSRTFGRDTPFRNGRQILACIYIIVQKAEPFYFLIAQSTWMNRFLPATLCSDYPLSTIHNTRELGMQLTIAWHEAPNEYCKVLPSTNALRLRYHAPPRSAIFVSSNSNNVSPKACRANVRTLLY